MNFSINRSTTHQAIIIVFTDEYDFANDSRSHNQQLWDMLEQEDRPVAVIVNMLDYKLDFDKLIQGTNSAIKSDLRPYSHTNCAALIVLTDQKLLQMSIDGFRQLGIAKTVKVAKSLDEALAMAP